MKTAKEEAYSEKLEKMSPQQLMIEADLILSRAAKMEEREQRERKFSKKKYMKKKTRRRK